MPSYPTWMKDEEIDPLLGERIGRGTGRNCFAVKSDDTVVVKEVHLPVLWCQYDRVVPLAPV